MASSCPTIRLRSWFSRSSACLPVLFGSSNVSFGILHLLPAPSGSLAFCVGASLNISTSRGAKELATRGSHLFEAPVCGFLAPYTKCCPGHGGKPLRVDVLIALLAGPKAAFLDTIERRTGVSKLVEFPVQVTNRECAL